MSLSNKDLFIKLLFNHKKGYYLNLGCGNGEGAPCADSTKYLEEEGWNGILIDSDQYLINEAATKFRKNSICICADAYQINYKKMLDELKSPKVIDYLQIDIDPIGNILDPNVKLLKLFPFEYYDFKVLCIETDLYQDRFGEYQKQSLTSFMKEKYKKYKLLAEDVTLCYNKNKPYENWYINLDYINEFNIEKIDQLFYQGENPNNIILDLASRRKQ